MERKEEAMATREPTAAVRSPGLFREFDRWFDQFRAGLEDGFWTPRFGALTAPRPGIRPALVDVKDTGKEIVVQAEVPGVNKDDLEINVTDDGLELKAEVQREREEKEQGYYFRERAQSGCYRLVPLPDRVIPDKADAELKDGVLTVRIPKKEPTEEKRPRKVRVR